MAVLTAIELVNEKWGMQLGLFDTTYNTTMEAVASLKQIASDFKEINETLSIDTTRISATAPLVVAPTLDDDDLTVNIPTDPAVPTLVDVTVPLDTLPSYPSLSVSSISAGGNSYSSALLTAIGNKLYNDLIDGSIGIEPAVETAIWNRENERATQAYNEGVDRESALWSKRGWSLPDGFFAIRTQELNINFVNKRLDVSRDISIKSAELALSNSHFVIQQGIAFESQLMQWANWVAQRIFEASKAVVEAEISKYGTEVGAITAERKSRLDAALARIEYNTGMIKMYASQVEAFNSKIKGEGIRVEAISRGSDAKVNLFRASADFELGKIGLDMKALDVGLNQAIQNKGLLIHDKEIRMKQAEFLNSLGVEAIKAGGSIAVQALAGIMAGYSVGAQVQAQSQVTELTELRYDMTKAIKSG